jgi:dTDP-4-dehydrorhamnose reductase
MAKYLGEQLLKSENSNAIIVRTSWLYGGWSQFKNFVNTMLKLAETRNELKVVNDQFWNPTYTKDLSKAMLDIVNHIDNYRWNIFHLSNQTEWNWITWNDFAQEIFRLTQKNIDCQKCSSEEFLTKAKRPQYSKLINDSEIVLRSWKEWLEEYIFIL